MDQSGLRGHGGAWFPVGTKWRSVAAGRSPVVVANGAEGEPASGKDRLLLHHAPHLVLDGASVAAEAVGSERVIVHVGADSVPDVSSALAERGRRRIDRCRSRSSLPRPLPVRSGIGRGQHGQRPHARDPVVRGTSARYGTRGSPVVPPWSRTSSRWPMSPSSPASGPSGSGAWDPRLPRHGPRHGDRTVGGRPGSSKFRSG